jgi:hypothetical protein
MVTVGRFLKKLADIEVVHFAKAHNLQIFYGMVSPIKKYKKNLHFVI